MIGIGKWEAVVSFMMIKISGAVEVRDNGGEYDFAFHLPEKYKDVKITYSKIQELPPDTLVVTGEASAFPGKPFTVTVTFKGDTVSGNIQCAGFNAKIKNGKRIG